MHCINENEQLCLNSLSVYCILLSFLLNCISAVASIVIVNISNRKCKYLNDTKTTMNRVEPAKQVANGNTSTMKVLTQATVDTTENYQQNTNASNHMCAMISILTWMQQRQQRKDLHSANQDRWDHLARKIDCVLFPIFLIAYFLLNVICLALITPRSKSE